MDTRYIDIDISIVHVSKLIIGHSTMNWMPGHSGVSYSRRLLEEAGKLLPVKDSAIVNAQFHSLGEAEFLCRIVMPALQSLLCGLGWTRYVPPPHHPYVISSSLMAVLLGTTQNSLSCMMFWHNRIVINNQHLLLVSKK